MMAAGSVDTKCTARGGNELNSSVGEYAGLVDETSGAVVPLQAGKRWAAGGSMEDHPNDFTGAYEIRKAVRILFVRIQSKVLSNL